MKILEGNKLIAEFMGNDYKNYETAVIGVISPEKAKYHSSWDWLMPVVSKIEEQGQSVSIFRGCCDIRFDKLEEGQEEPEPIESGGGQPKIISVWQSVTQFIQWYNNQPK